MQQYLHQYPLDLPSWQIVDLLHDSTNATIYRARNSAGLAVAIKRFKFSLAGVAPEVIERVLMNMRALGVVKTDGLVRVLEVNIYADVIYLVMEYIQGSTLKRLLQLAPIPALTVRLQWFKELTQALQAVHELGLLHLDLKTSNVMIRHADNALALLDFGLETRLLIDTGFMREDEIYCTPYYVSPERIMGESPDERADLYALGIILYELLVGRKPYESTNLTELLKKHALAPIPRLPATFVAYQPLLDGLLAKFPENRIQSATDVASILHDITHY